MNAINLEQAQRGEVRWRILQTLNVGRPLGVSEQVILNVLADSSLRVTVLDVRRELDYLRDRNLVTISGEERGVWLAELNADGVDVVEYTTEAPSGVSRPRRW